MTDDAVPKASATPIQPTTPFIIVGIGAVTASIPALTQLLNKINNYKTASYLIALQTSAPQLQQFLQYKFPAPIQLIDAETQIQAGQIYLLPLGMNASYLYPQLVLEPSQQTQHLPSIEYFFTSLAQQQGTHSIGITLEGTGTDGRLGLQSILTHGGTVFSQQATPPYLQQTLSPVEIAQQLQFTVENINALLIKLPQAPRFEHEIQQILEILLEKTNCHFYEYKYGTLLRRIGRRMEHHKLNTLPEYLSYLHENPEEIYALHNAILIAVTSFFRDEDAFQALREQLAQQLNVAQPLRIWVAGCSSGEEAYSIAILLREYFSEQLTAEKINIYATDLHEGRLALARQGHYHQAALQHLPQSWIDKYFIQYGHQYYQICPEIRTSVTFTRHDLTTPPPYTHLDLICCRNVLIYFTTKLQQQVIQGFQHSLKPGGLLLLGKSETLDTHKQAFTAMNYKAHLYLRQAESSPQASVVHAMHQQIQDPVKSQAIPAKQLYQYLVEHYQPDYLLLNQQQQILHKQGHVDTFLQTVSNAYTRHVHELLHEELRDTLHNLFQQIQQGQRKASSAPVAFPTQHSQCLLTLHLQILNTETTLQYQQARYFLLFETQTLQDQQTAPVDVQALNWELQQARQQLHATQEGLDITKAALQSSYEKSHATNEELHASNEELQTSNEELRSLNQALAKANQQLQLTNAQLVHEIEERKQVEQHLQLERSKLSTIFKTQPNWINICTQTGLIQQINPAGLAIMQADDAQQLIGRSLTEFIQPESQQPYCKYLQGHTTDTSPLTCEISVKTLQGETRWLEIHTVPLQLEPEQSHLLSIIVDHTKHRQTQEQLSARQQELSRIMRLNTLGEMASGIAHELNQPLSAIANYAQGCERRIQHDNCTLNDVREVMRLVNAQVRRAGDILRYTKDFTRKDQSIEQHSHQLNTVIEEILQLLATTEILRNIQVKLTLEPQLPNVVINKIQIEQVMINLLQNAVDATLEAHPEQALLRIQTHIYDEQSIEVRIIDSGGGLPENFEEDIFRPFHTTKKNGMGMGLAISRSIIESHGGKLEAVNNSNHSGAIFSFTLPTEENNQP